MKHFLKNKGKRFTAVLLSAVMCLAAFPMSAFAWTSEAGKSCTSYFGEKYVGSDGEYYYSKSTLTSLFYNEDGSTYTRSYSSGNAKSKYYILEPVEYSKKDGTTGISYNVKKVFDVTQTTANRQPAPTANRDPRQLVAVMLDTSPVNKEMADELPFPNMGAFYNNEKQTLYVKRNIGDSVALCQCVAQELGHAQLSMNSEVYSRRDMGFQAVCVGYMLCKKFGVDTKNFAIDRIPDELAKKEPKEIRAELSKTRTAMNEIYSRVSDELYRQKQERSKDMER